MSNSKKILQNVGRCGFYLFNGMIVLFLILPFIAIIPMSFSSAMFLTYPPPGFSMKWFAQFFSNPEWNSAMRLSFEVALAATFLSLVLGTSAALGFDKKISVKKIALIRMLFIGLIISPAVCPVVVAAVAKLMFFLDLGLYDTILGLIIAHTVLAVPFVFISVASTLNNVDRFIEKAALNLGASKAQTFFRITLPLIRPGILIGAVFAFMNSFNEIVVTVFITGSNTITLSRKLWNGIQYEIDPMVTVVSTLIVAFSILILFLFSFIRQKSSHISENLVQ